MRHKADGRKRAVTAALWVWVFLLAAVSVGRAEVARFQNGVAPTAGYQGCVDTRISVYNDREATRGAGKSAQLLTYSNARRVLVRFDIGALPKGRAVRRALLRLYCAAPTGLASKMYAFPLTREWDDSATGFEHKKTDDNKSPADNWTKKGGDYDDKVKIEAAARGGAFGHGFEFDVTELVADWVAGKRANHGVIVWSSQHTQHSIASSEWPIAAYRPELLVEHVAAAKAGEPSELTRWSAPAKVVELSAAAKTPLRKKPVPGKVGVFRQGVATGCNVVSGVTDAYVKTNPELAGRWGWMPMLRVGGSAGDFNVGLMSFDLRVAPVAAVAVLSAKLRVCVVGGSPGTRFGLYLAREDAPRWVDEMVTLAEARAGVPWGKGGIRGAFEELPVAVASFPRARRNQKGPTWIEWDVTGAVRARVKGMLNVAMLHDVEGGAFDAYSSKCHDPALRPVLELRLSQPLSIPAVNPAALKDVTGDYWLWPMKAVHARFKGKAGTLGQYGDSITITMAFLATHSYGASCIPAKCPDEVKKRLAVLDRYADRTLWRGWKGPRFGNNGNMTSAWARANIKSWQALCKPEVAVIMFGTNDVSYGPVPPQYTENLAYVVDRCLADGTIPILTTASPRGDQKTRASSDARVKANRQAVLAIARAKKVPLIDFYGEILARQPEKWDKTLMGDSLHPSYRNPWKRDFTEEGLKNSGYTLRNYLTFEKYAQIIQKVLLPAAKGEGK